MADTRSATGKCLCGAVTVTADIKHHNVGACHCSMCQKWSGSPFLAVEAAGDVHIDGQEYITSYQSSDWAERAFCNKCGSNLFYYFIPRQMHIFAASIFEDVTGFEMDHQIFIDEKPAYYDFANETAKMTGAEVVASFEGEG